MQRLSATVTPTQPVDAILEILFSERRVLQDKTCATTPCESCWHVQRTRVLRQVQAGLPLHFILPAFPAKSMNRDKTASPLPDLGERLSLRFLQDFCERIRQIYAPGARLTICSDGRVFNDLVLVEDAHVAAYASGIATIIKEEALTHLSTFNLDQYVNGLSFERMRALLEERFAEPLAQLKARTKSMLADNALFNGIHRFIYEDQKSVLSQFTNNQIKLRTKAIAYEVIRRSNAWSRLIQEKFPDALRLSIHPQPCQSEKIGIMLLKSQSAWATPWHRVTVFDGEAYHLMRKAEAESLEAKQVLDASGQFSHYQLGK